MPQGVISELRPNKAGRLIRAGPLWVSLFDQPGSPHGEEATYKLVVRTAIATAAAVTTTLAAAVAAAFRAANCDRHLLADAFRYAAGHGVGDTPRNTLRYLDRLLVAHRLADRIAHRAGLLLGYH